MKTEDLLRQIGMHIDAGQWDRAVEVIRQAQVEAGQQSGDPMEIHVSDVGCDPRIVHTLDMINVHFIGQLAHVSIAELCRYPNVSLVMCGYLLRVSHTHGVRMLLARDGEKIPFRIRAQIERLYESYWPTDAAST